MQYAVSLEKLIEQFQKLPSVGLKSAQRMAYHILSLPEEKVKAFADAIVNAKKNIHYCAVCCDYTDEDLCSVCKSDKRDKGTICVVEESKDVVAIEKTGEYFGTYHVLHGRLSPVKKIGADDIMIKPLLERFKDGEVSEVIMATNPNIEGEATAMYIARLLKPFGVKVTRLAYGIPVGADLEFADDMTLRRAIEGRKEF
ncbi:MAG: recombination protein RecR [Clostridia bacterium]|nr:recombination protein RecR [Clostridia bacterium]